jgi:LacI family transcriptional regulator
LTVAPPLRKNGINFVAVGKQPVTIYDIALLAKVSQSTVSRVLNGSARVAAAKRAAVLEAIEALKYKPNVVARGLAKGRSQAVGVLTLDNVSPFYGQILTGIERGLRGTGYHPLVLSVAGSEDTSSALDLLMASRIETLVVIGEPIRDHRLVRIGQEIPVVAVGPSVPGLEDRCLHADNREGAAAAARYLLSLGHTRIAHIAGPPGHRHATDRREGYGQALAEAGRAADPDLVVEGAFDERSGLVAAERLLAQGARFTALFCANDPMAYGAMLALHRRGLRVPQDVSIVGFDDQPHAAYTTPPLTTVRQPTIEMGAAAIKILLASLRGEPWTLPVFKTELVVRESAAPPDAGPGGAAGRRRGPAAPRP